MLHTPLVNKDIFKVQTPNEQEHWNFTRIY